MFEEFIYDENGQQLTTDFENYRIASAADVPDIEVNHAPTPCEQNTAWGEGSGRGPARPGSWCFGKCDLRRAGPIRCRDNKSTASATENLGGDHCGAG